MDSGSSTSGKRSECRSLPYCQRAIWRSKMELIHDNHSVQSRVEVQLLFNSTTELQLWTVTETTAGTTDAKSGFLISPPAQFLLPASRSSARPITATSLNMFKAHCRLYLESFRFSAPDQGHNRQFLDVCKLHRRPEDIH